MARARARDGLCAQTGRSARAGDRLDGVPDRGRCAAGERGLAARERRVAPPALHRGTAAVPVPLAACLLSLLKRRGARPDFPLSPATRHARSLRIIRELPARLTSPPATVRHRLKEWIEPTLAARARARRFLFSPLYDRMSAPTGRDLRFSFAQYLSRIVSDSDHR